MVFAKGLFKVKLKLKWKSWVSNSFQLVLNHFLLCWRLRAVGKVIATWAHKLLSIRTWQWLWRNHVAFRGKQRGRPWLFRIHQAFKTAVSHHVVEMGVHRALELKHLLLQLNNFVLQHDIRHLLGFFSCLNALQLLAKDDSAHACLDVLIVTKETSFQLRELRQHFVFRYLNPWSCSQLFWNFISWFWCVQNLVSACHGRIPDSRLWFFVISRLHVFVFRHGQLSFHYQRHVIHGNTLFLQWETEGFFWDLRYDGRHGLAVLALNNLLHFLQFEPFEFFNLINLFLLTASSKLGLFEFVLKLLEHFIVLI